MTQKQKHKNKRINHITSPHNIEIYIESPNGNLQHKKAKTYSNPFNYMSPADKL